MTEQLKLKLNDSKATRWGALVIVAFTMMAAYYVKRRGSTVEDNVGNGLGLVEYRFRILYRWL